MGVRITFVLIFISILCGLAFAGLGSGPRPPGSVSVTPIPSVSIFPASGTTGIVTATMPAVLGKTNYICWLEVDAVDSAGPVTISPMTLTGVLGGTVTYNGVNAIATPGTVFTHSFGSPSGSPTPCLAGSAANTAISFATTADATGGNIQVFLSGYTQ